LLTGDFGYKDVKELLELKKNINDVKKELRCSLDILGETYDDWRQALEKG
jgi:hypothetical protein